MSLATAPGSPQGVTGGDPPEERPLDRALRGASVPLAGFAIVAFTNAIAIAATIPPPARASLRLAHHAFDAAQTLGLGLVDASVLGVAALVARGKRSVELALAGATAAPVVHVVLGADLERQAQVALEGTLATPLRAVFTLLCALAIPVALLLGGGLARRPKLRYLPFVLVLGGIVTNHVVVRDDYPGLHGAITWAAATMGGALAAPLVRGAWRPARVRAWMAGLAAIGVAGLVASPSNDARIELFRAPGATGAWALALTAWPRPAIAATAPAPTPRAEATPPTEPRLFANPPLVVLLTVDATRAEAVLEPTRASMFPTFTRLGSLGATFTRATAPGSQTSVSLTTVFTGRYFSELYWAMHGEGSARFEYASKDPTPRFPALLTATGVATESFCSLKFLEQEFGAATGFAKQNALARGREHVGAQGVIEPLIHRLRRVKDEPAFFFAHLTEPHAPYDRGAQKTGPDYDRYLAEIAVADAQIGRVERLLAQRFPDRGVLIVSSDHGEAFGEHDTFFHTKTLYEELLHVPLFVKGPGVAKRRVEERVGLVDLGPTILDLFGVPSPPSMRGRSLVPLLAGRDEPLERPLFAEGRLRRAYYDGDLKVIEDERRKVVEAYDLAADPGELTNLFDVDRARVEPAVATLRAFFEASTFRREGYAPPYKP
jgi:arylsulfatase A-like enzyme